MRLFCQDKAGKLGAKFDLAAEASVKSEAVLRRAENLHDTLFGGSTPAPRAVAVAVAPVVTPKVCGVCIVLGTCCCKRSIVCLQVPAGGTGTLKRPAPALAPAVGGQPPVKAPKNMENYKCFKCQQKGHSISECPNPRVKKSRQ
jgi:hypothetical protein